MHPTRIFADLTVPDIEEARDFYVDYLGRSDEQIKMDWVTRFVSQTAGSRSNWSPATSPPRRTRRSRWPSQAT